MAITPAEDHAIVSEHLRYHSWLYYIAATPVLFDHEFDREFRYLQRLEARYPELRTPTSPTQSVGAPVEEPPCSPALRAFVEKRLNKGLTKATTRGNIDVMLDAMKGRDQ